MIGFMDKDWSVPDAKCEHYCWPSCHPMQTGPEHVYGCRHPHVQTDGFVPIVRCDGDPESEHCLLKK